MQLPVALEIIRSALSRLTALYGQPVFDEWCVVGLRPDGSGVLAYEGPRRETFRQQFVQDVAPLQQEVAAHAHEPGDFHFAIDAEGTHYDALLAIGPGVWLLCNHTQRTLDHIRHQSAWRRAQVAWLQLSERFRSAPVEA